MRYIFYNPISGAGKARELAENFALSTPVSFQLIDMTAGDYLDTLDALGENDIVVLFGGDGTLNCFVNSLYGKTVPCPVYYYGAGTGNDFTLDIGASNIKEPVEITKHLASLPTVVVGDRQMHFINGVGYGIDGYCCEVGDRIRGEGKVANYTNIAIMGLLFHYHPTNAHVTVDGVEYDFKKVWIAPTMLGSHYGGGMIPTPEQKREDDTLSLMVFHGSSKLKTLMIFPSIFKGEHIKNEKYVTVLRGKTIKVTFDSPRPLQIDGETILDVKEYVCKR